MSTFNAIGVASTGVTVYRKWLDAVSDNVANMNTVTRTSESAFRERYIVAQEAGDGNGVQVGGAAFGNAEGRVVHDPAHPLADADGNVRMPDIDLGSQMGQLVMAQRGYQANLSVVERAKDSYNAAIQLGKGS
ncbi:flagellar basal-body rod protein FlgC [Catenuloplanes nepalensis]|uniref:Flagellar basal-body rod protein FlgC n=1 Tax=Catenuloplanes nepalensis TaxID=587533 RepID=A0ABT9N317_9ACTN|nr:flagellar basal body rod C-terminal domain-containing protein [Catenuloplanes nepalensis]MDP9798041.1 flagellar basal-body rod protein FlgC [Catenuloplanes nepalensis]